VKTMMNVLKVQSLLQVDAVEGELEVDDPDQADESSQEEDETDVKTLDPKNITLEETKEKNAQIKQADDIVQEVHSRGKGKKADAKSKDIPLANITADVFEEVTSVEQVMDAIQKEENKNEVLGSEVSNRIQVLIGLLQTESEECQNDAQLALGAAVAPPPVPPMEGMLASGQEAVSSSESDGQSVLQSKGKGKGKGKSGHKRMAMLIQALGPDSTDLTFANLTTLILDEVSGLEDNIHALIEEKNKLSVADSQDMAHLDNLDDNLDTEGAGPEGLQLALQVGKQREGSLLQTRTKRQTEGKPMKKAKAQASTRKEKAAAHETNRTAELQRKQSTEDEQTEEDTVAKQEEEDDEEEETEEKPMKKTKAQAPTEKKTANANDADHTAELQRKQSTEDTEDTVDKEEDEDEQEEQEQEKEKDMQVEKTDIHSKTATKREKWEPKAFEAKVGKVPTLDFHNMSLSNLTAGINSQVANLEADIGTLRATRVKACAASKNTLARLEVIVGVLSTMEC